MPADRQAGNRYGRTSPDLASVREFVDGYMQYQHQLRKDAVHTIMAGLLTAAAVSAYTNRRR